MHRWGWSWDALGCRHLHRHFSLVLDHNICIRYKIHHLLSEEIEKVADVYWISIMKHANLGYQFFRDGVIHELVLLTWQVATFIVLDLEVAEAVLKGFLFWAGMSKLSLPYEWSGGIRYYPAARPYILDAAKGDGPICADGFRQAMDDTLVKKSNRGEWSTDDTLVARLKFRCYVAR